MADPALGRAIVEDAGIGSEDVVLEVGPGRGALTTPLCDSAKTVIAIEIDSKLAEQLPLLVKHDSLQVVNSDALKTNWSDLAKEAGTDRLSFVSNLPYNITAPIVGRLIDSRSLVPKATVMIQREVAERLASAPGSRSYGVLSVMLGALAHVELGRLVRPGAFIPPPKVDSRLLHIGFDMALSPDLPGLWAVVKAAFSQRRKVLRNAWPPGLGCPLETVTLAAEKAGVDLALRAERLSPGQFVAMTEAMRHLGWSPGGGRKGS